MSWLPVANIHGVVAALFSITPKYCVQTSGSKLSNPFAEFAGAAFFTGFPEPLGSA